MAAIGFVEVAATARVIQLGHPASAGTVLAVWAAGSVAGGLVYGSRDWPGRAASQLRVLLLLVAGGFAVVAVARDMAWLYPLMLGAGLATAPAAAALTASFSTAGAAAARTGSFAWLASCSSLSDSVGYAAAGLLLAHATITATILVGAALPMAAATAVPRGRPSGMVMTSSSQPVAAAIPELQRGLPHGNDGTEVTLPMDDGEIYVHQDGPRNAPALLLIHGNASSTRSWDELVPILTRSHRVISEYVEVLARTSTNYSYNSHGQTFRTRSGLNEKAASRSARRPAG